jgi:transposase-like protein
MVIPNVKRESLDSNIKDHVEQGASVYTDKLRSYNHLGGDYVHNVIDHAVKYVEGHVHTNGIENFWSLLKRMLRGTYVSVEPYHLFRYLDEQSFRFNNRKGTDADRFLKTALNIGGKRLTYKQLTGKEPQGDGTSH